MESSPRKSIILSLKMQRLSQFFPFLAITLETFHFSQKLLKDRLLLSTEKKVSKKVKFIFIWKVLIKFQSQKTVRKSMNVFYLILSL